MLASRDDMGWRGWIHAKRRKEVAAWIVIKLRRANIDRVVRRCRVESSKDIIPIHREVPKCPSDRINQIVSGIATKDHIPRRAQAAEHNAVVLSSRDHIAVRAQGHAVEQRTWKVLIEVRPPLPGVRRSYDASVIALIHDARRSSAKRRPLVGRYGCAGLDRDRCPTYFLFQSKSRLRYLCGKEPGCLRG